MLIAEIKRQNKPYGLYFEQVTGGYTLTQRRGLQAFTVIPLIVYRVYPDGRPDELVRGRRYRRHAAFELCEDPGDIGQAARSSTATAAPNPARCRCRPVSPALLVSEIEIQKKGPFAATGRRCFPGPRGKVRVPEFARFGR